jgi:fatty acid desaturase
MSKHPSSQLAWRERYRLIVSLLIIPLGGIIIVRAALVGVQAWTLIVLGAAMVVLGMLRLRAYVQHSQAHGKTVSRRKRG